MALKWLYYGFQAIAKRIPWPNFKDRLVEFSNSKENSQVLEKFLTTIFLMVELIKPEFDKWLDQWIFFQQNKKAYNFKANMFCFEWTLSCAPNVLRASFWLFGFKRIVNTQVSWVFFLPVASYLLPCYNAKKQKCWQWLFNKTQAVPKYLASCD